MNAFSEVMKGKLIIFLTWKTSPPAVDIYQALSHLTGPDMKHKHTICWTRLIFHGGNIMCTS